MSGAIATEYAAQVRAPSKARPSPLRSVESSPPDPIATSATPANERQAASQKRRLRCSTRLTRATSAVKIGNVPNSNATVVAVVNFSVDEAELIAEEHRRAEDDERELAAADPERVLPRKCDRGEEDGRAGVADG